MAKPKTATEQKTAARAGAIQDADLVSDALRSVIKALVPLEFNRRRDVVRWACEFYGIDPTKVGLTYYPER